MDIVFSGVFVKDRVQIKTDKREATPILNFDGQISILPVLKTT